MTRYRFAYYEEESGYIYFDAENLTEAEALFEQVENREIDYDELPNAVRKSRNGQNEFESLEEVK